jgi:hypothetical protein
VTKQKIIMLTGSKEHTKLELMNDIDEEVLEASYGGLDSRPFDSNLYLDGPFHHDYKKILDVKHSVVDNGSVTNDEVTDSSSTSSSKETTITRISSTDSASVTD